jgi:hypothetical protein
MAAPHFQKIAPNEWKRAPEKWCCPFRVTAIARTWQTAPEICKIVFFGSGLLAPPAGTQVWTQIFHR